MTATCSLWRSLLAVFQIVTLVAFSVAGAGHTHAATMHNGHGPMVAHMRASEPAQPKLSGHDAQQAGDAAASSCSLNCCCCHTPVLLWDCCAVLVSWKPGQTLAGVRAVSFDSVASETLPEPPRTFA